MAQLKKITIDPVTRLEGHGKVTIHLDGQGEVREARFHVTQFRGYERFCQGRPMEEMPAITQRICGICPVSHQLGSAKACDAILGVEIPETARLLRELLHMGQYIQSHALHFFHLASPDLLLGWDAEPARRNVVGIAQEFPEAALKGIRLRRFGQEIIGALGGKRIHPVFAVPGGVSNPLSPQDRDRLLQGFPEAYQAHSTAMELFQIWWEKNKEEALSFASFPSNYAGLVDSEGMLALYHGDMRICGPGGEEKAKFAPQNYLEQIAEKVESWSYLKFPYFRAEGFPGGAYRVGPLARLNVSRGITTPRAQEAFLAFRGSVDSGLPQASLHYHHARLVELLHALERAQQLLETQGICSTHVRSTVSRPAQEEGVGVVEAPRGTLIHHYQVDSHGVIRKANLIVATGHNNLAMNQAVTSVARSYIHGGQVKEGILNRIEGAIRCYDPCLSCSTHALGQMPLTVEVYGPEGDKILEMRRP
jgi:NAD-reducing hydrogenase large subunit